MSEEAKTGERKMIFRAYGVTNEFDLNKLALNVGMKKKYTWEEPLVLKGDVLKQITKQESKEEQAVMIFAFGSLVFINTPEKQEKEVISYLQKFRPEISEWGKYNETYELRISENTTEIDFEDKYVSIPENNVFYSELLAIVIAKSVALEKTEEQLEVILDNVESLIDRLENGKMNISNRKLSKSISKILRHQYNTIAYIMILDKPEVTWNNSEADAFYERLSGFYELSSRYQVIKEKTNILNDIIGGFTNMSHAIKGFVIDWIITILIVLEVIVMTIEIFR